MIVASGLTKTYGAKTAVDGISFTVEPGRVTGFLGPNGAGKSTTMRVLVGLTEPTAGSATILGRRFADLPNPGREVGVLLDASAQHAGRTGREILTIAARTMGLPKNRVGAMLDRVSLTEEESGRRVRNYSLGMRQRLGIATALLGDPAVVMLDEPVNGLDPDGIRWIRGLLRGLAAEGRTVFLSSHLMSEMALTADHLVIVGRGRLLADVPTADMIAAASTVVRVRSPRAEELAGLLTGPDVTVERHGDVLSVTGRTVESVAEVAFEQRLLLHELTPVSVSLEDAYMALTRDDVEYCATTTDTIRTDTTPRRAAA